MTVRSIVAKLVSRKPSAGQFVARYDGKCAACGRPIKAGDLVGKVFMQRRRIGNLIGDDPYRRTCCGRCHADAAKCGDPSLKW